MSGVSPRTSRLGIAGALALLAVGVFLAVFRGDHEVEQRLARLRKAGYPLNPAELNAWYPSVPEDENLAPKVLDAAMTIQANSSDTNLLFFGKAARARPGQRLTPLQIAAAKSFQRENADPLSKLSAALQRPKSRFPVDLSGGYGTATTPFAPLKNAMYALSIEAELNAEEGLGMEAVQHLVAGLKLADAVGEQPEILPYVESFVLRKTSLGAAEFVLSRQVHSEVDLATLQQQCMRATGTTSFERAMAGEFAMVLGLLALPWKNAEPTIVSLGPMAGIPEPVSAPALRLYWMLNLKGRDRRVVVGYIDEALSALRLPDGQQWPALRKAQKKLQAQVSHQFLPIARSGLSLSENLVNLPFVNQTLLRAAATACAVERYRLAHGDALPETLEALVPNFIPSVPLDPWTQQPLRYRKLSPGYVIYGVGQDGKDDDGVSVGGRPKGVPGGYDDAFTVGR